MPHAVAVAVPAAQKQIQRAAQVAFALVVGQAFAQVAVQRQQINRRLQVVARLGQRRGQRGRGVVGAQRAQPVGFVIHHVIAAVVTQHQVGKAFEHAVERVGGQRRARQAGQQHGAGVGVQRRQRQLLGGKPEFQFGLIGAQPGQGGRRAGQAQRGVQPGQQLFGQRVDQLRPLAQRAAARHAVAQRRRVGGHGGKAGVRHPFQQAVHKHAAGGAGRQRIQQRRQAAHGAGRLALGVGLGFLGHVVMGGFGQRRGLGVQAQGQPAIAADAPGRRRAQPAGAGGGQRRGVGGRRQARRGQAGVKLSPGQFAGGGVFGVQPVAAQRRHGGIVDGRAAVEQVAQRAFVQGVALAAPAPERGDAQPQRVAGAGDRHIKQPQVFLQALAVLRQALVFALEQRQRRPIGVAVFLVIAIGRQPRAVHRPVAGGKRQHGQRIFQAFGFVDGHHPHQAGVAFQADNALVAAAIGPGDALGQAADQRVFAVQQLGVGVQKLGQVQEVGQRAFAAVARQAARRHIKAVQQLAQHGQHALPPPAGVQRDKAFDFGVPVARAGLALRVQPGVGQVQRGGGQRGAHPALLGGFGAGAQPVQEVGGFAAGKHRIAVGQIHALDAASSQRRAHAFCLAAVAHQDGDVGGGERAPAAVGVGKAGVAGLRAGQQRAHLGGAALGHAFAVAGGVQRLGVQPHLQGRQRRALVVQGFPPAGGAHRLKRQ